MRALCTRPAHVRFPAAAAMAAAMAAAAAAHALLPTSVRLELARKAAAERSIRNETSAAGRRFAEYDLDGNCELDFDEFYAMLPRSTREECSRDDVRVWFDTCDTDSTGLLSLNEFWLFSMSAAGQKYGAQSLEEVFSRYDTDRTGFLDVSQFERMAYETGLAVGATEMYKSLSEGKAALGLKWKEVGSTTATMGGNEIFNEELGAALTARLEFTLPELEAFGVKLKHGNYVKGGKPGHERYFQPITSGKLSHSNLANAIQKRIKKVDPQTKTLLTTLIRSAAEGSKDEARELLTKTWTVIGRDAATVRASLQEQLHSSDAQVADLLKLFDVDADPSCLIDSLEFYNAMRSKFGYGGSFYIIEEVFNSLDDSHNGTIGFDELFEFVRGRRHSLDRRSKRVRDMVCKPPSWATYTLEGIAWDAETLHRQIWQMLMARRRVRVKDVSRAFDKRGLGRLGRSDFMDCLHCWFHSAEELWKQELEPIAGAVFDALVGPQGKADDPPTLSLLEFESWLTVPDGFEAEEPRLKKGARRTAAPRQKIQSRAVLPRYSAIQQAEAAMEEFLAKKKQAEADAKSAKSKTVSKTFLLAGALRNLVDEIEEPQQPEKALEQVSWEAPSSRGDHAWAGSHTKTLDINEASMEDKVVHAYSTAFPPSGSPRSGSPLRSGSPQLSWSPRLSSWNHPPGRISPTGSSINNSPAGRMRNPEISMPQSRLGFPPAWSPPTKSNLPRSRPPSREVSRPHSAYLVNSVMATQVYLLSDFRTKRPVTHSASTRRSGSRSSFLGSPSSASRLARPSQRSLQSAVSLSSPILLTNASLYMPGSAFLLPETAPASADVASE